MSYVNINNATAFLVLITWHQKEPLVCVVYSHYPTDDSTAHVYRSAAYLAIMLLSLSYIAKVTKNQKIFISPYILTQQKSIFSLLWLNFQTYF